MGLQTAGRSRAAKTSTGGQGIVGPMCVCVCVGIEYVAEKTSCQGGNMSRWV